MNRQELLRELFKSRKGCLPSAIFAKRIFLEWFLCFSVLAWLAPFPMFWAVWFFISFLVAIHGGVYVTAKDLFASVGMYELTHGALRDLKAEDLFASDLVERFEVALPPGKVLEQISNNLTKLDHTEFIKFDADAGELSAVASPAGFFRRCEVYVRVQAIENNRSTVAVRVISSAFSQCADSLLVQNLIRCCESDVGPCAPRKRANIRRVRVPLWLPPVLEKVLSVATLTLLACLIPWHNSDLKIKQYLSSGQYASALTLIENHPEDSESRIKKFQALLGLGRYGEAINQLDANERPEYVALARAKEGKFSEAQQLLNTASPEHENLDIGVKHLAQGLLDAHAHKNAKAFDELRIFQQCGSSELCYLPGELALQLANAVGTKKIQDDLREENLQRMKFASEPTGYEVPPWWFAILSGSLLGGYLLAALHCHKRWHKSPNGFPDLAVPPLDLYAPDELEQAFDRCLTVLSSEGFTITNMDDEAGVLDAITDKGDPLVIKLTPAESGGTTIRITAPVMQHCVQGRESLIQLKVALSQA